MKNVCSYVSPLGRITLMSETDALCGLWFEGQKYYPAIEAEEGMTPVLQETVRWLDIYFSGRDPGFTPPLVYGRTGFERIIDDIMLTIPYGGLMTYGGIAKQAAEILGKPHMSAQAVGGAVGHNRISLIIPCHRVVGTDGSLTGYAGGTWRKERLLAGEGIYPEKRGLYIPAR